MINFRSSEICSNIRASNSFPKAALSSLRIALSAFLVKSIRQATVRPYLVDAVGLKPASTIVLDILENPVLVLETVDSFLQGFVNVEAPRPASLLRKTAVALVQLGWNPH